MLAIFFLKVFLYSPFTDPEQADAKTGGKRFTCGGITQKAVRNWNCDCVGCEMRPKDLSLIKNYWNVTLRTTTCQVANHRSAMSNYYGLSINHFRWDTVSQGNRHICPVSPDVRRVSVPCTRTTCSTCRSRSLCGLWSPPRTPAVPCTHHRFWVASASWIVAAFY